MNQGDGRSRAPTSKVEGWDNVSVRFVIQPDGHFVHPVIRLFKSDGWRTQERVTQKREPQRETEKEGVLEAWQEAALNMKFFSVMEFCFFWFLVNSSGRFPVCIFRTNYIIFRNVEIFPNPPPRPPKHKRENNINFFRIIFVQCPFSALNIQK
jgi:hypothetical protein